MIEPRIEPEESAVHLLLREGAPVSAPSAIPPTSDGAQALAALYALPSDRVHVRAMMNTTVDGAVTGADGTSGTLRNPDDSFVFGVLRALTDVVLVGAATVRAEDYRRPQGRRDLLVPSHRPAGGDRPALAIWSASGELPATIDADWPTYLIAPPHRAAAAGRRARIPADQVIAASTATEAVVALAEKGYRGIQAEGGPASLARLAAEGLLDELCFSVTHRTVGGSSLRVMAGLDHDQAWRLDSLISGQHATITRYLRAD